MTHDNFTTLLVALINALPWIVGLWLDRERRLEKAARERNHRANRNASRSAKTDSPNLPDEHRKGRIGRGSGDGSD